MYRPPVMIAAILLAGTIAVDARAALQPGSMLTLAVLPDRDGTRHVFEVGVDRVDRLPRWDQQLSPEPPLTASEARQTAERWLRERHPKVTRFELLALGLSRVFPPPGPGPLATLGCWHYRVSFEPFAGERRMAGGSEFVAVVLLDGSIVEPRLETKGTPAPAAQATPIDRGPGGIYQVGDVGVTAPKILTNLRSQYTRAAMEAKIKGTVTVQAVVNADGTVGDVKVTKSLDSVLGLDNAAVEAVKKSRFVPASRLNVPVAYLQTIELVFDIR